MFGNNTKYLGIILLNNLLACNTTQSDGATRIMDFGSFTLETPNSWRQVKERGIDSYVGKIVLDDNDVLYFDLGWYSNDLTEYLEVKLGDNKTYYVSAADTAYSPTLVDSSDMHHIVKSHVIWDTIDGRPAKILRPIKSGRGTTGIYFDSLWQSGSDIDKFNLYGSNLRPQNETNVLAAFKTLKFYKSEQR